MCIHVVQLLTLVRTTADVVYLLRVGRSTEECTITSHAFHHQLEKLATGATVVDGPLWHTNIISKLNHHCAFRIKSFFLDCPPGSFPYIESADINPSYCGDVNDSSQVLDDCL